MLKKIDEIDGGRDLRTEISDFLQGCSCQSIEDIECTCLNLEAANNDYQPSSIHYQKKKENELDK